MATAQASSDLTGWKLRNALHRNLLLLGFKPEKCNIKIDKDTFKVPNHKAFQIVSQFLIVQYDPKKEEELRSCWPIVGKKQERDFRALCYKCLRHISETDPKCNLPHFTGSLFLSPGGKAFCHLYLNFTTYIMKKIIERDHSEAVLLPRPKNKLEKDLMHAATLADLEVYQKNHRAIQDITSTYETLFRKGSADYWKMTGEIESLQHTMKEKVTEVTAGANDPEEYYRTTDQLQEELWKQKIVVDDAWNTIAKQFAIIYQCSTTLESALKPSKDRLSIDGKDFTPKTSAENRQNASSVPDVQTKISIDFASNRNPALNPTTVPSEKDQTSMDGRDFVSSTNLEDHLYTASNTLSILGEKLERLKEIEMYVPVFDVTRRELNVDVGDLVPELIERLRGLRIDSQNSEDEPNDNEPFEILPQRPHFGNVN